MNSLHIGGNEIRLAVNDDKNRIISFNPTDVGFIDRFYGLIAQFDAQQTEFEQRAKALDAQDERDAYGVPANVRERIALIKEFCERMRSSVDGVFGEGTSQKAFGAMNTLDMFAEFFEGITPYVKQARERKLAKYQKVADRS